MPPEAKRFSADETIGQNDARRRGVCDLPYRLSVGMVTLAGGAAIVTILIAVIYSVATIFFLVGQWVPVDSAPAHLTVYKIRGPDPTPYFGLPIIASGVLVIAAGVIHFSALGVEQLFEHTRKIEWQAIGIWALFAAVAFGLGGNCTYTTATSNSIVIDHPAETITIDRAFIFKTDVHDVIPFSDVTGVRYRYKKSSPSDSYDVDFPDGWVYLTVQGRKEREIAAGIPRWLRDMAEDISAATGVRLAEGK